MLGFGAEDIRQDPDATEIRSAFARFASQAEHVIAWGDDEGARAVLEAASPSDVVIGRIFCGRKGDSVDTSAPLSM